MPVVILHHLLNVSVQLANKRGLKKIPNSFYEFDLTWLPNNETAVDINRFMTYIIS
jgi:hypothetical protein